MSTIKDKEELYQSLKNISNIYIYIETFIFTGVTELMHKIKFPIYTYKVYVCVDINFFFGYKNKLVWFQYKEKDIFCSIQFDSLYLFECEDLHIEKLTSDSC